jgi:hypothetical protein
MTYYFMLLVLVLGVAYFIDALRKKYLKHFLISVGILLFAVILGIAANTTSIMATKEYADWSTRGKQTLTITPEGETRENRNGLDREYITQYSYGIAESLNLFIPRLFGGSNSEDLGTDSKAYTYLTEQGLARARALDFAGSLPLYWGKQPGVAAPAYIGAIVCFLFILSLFLVRGRRKWWLLAGAILSLLLSWGKNFGLLTDFMIDYFPLYNKFRAVSSIQVILELCVPILAVLALAECLKNRHTTAYKIKALKISILISLGIGALVLLSKGLFDFTGVSDATYQQYFGDEIMAMIRGDREAVFVGDTIRSLIFVLLSALVLWLYLKERIGSNLLLLALGLMIAVDLIGVDLRYVNKDDFVRSRQMDEPFRETAVDKEISSDPGVFRVYDPSEGLNGARTSFFHHSIGGYHAAKPAGMQDLFDFHIYKGNMGVLNMLNVKYVIQKDEDGKDYAGMNPEANGNAWFVDRLVTVADANAEIKALDSLKSKTIAVVNRQMFPDKTSMQFVRDSSATISLRQYAPDRLIYSSDNTEAGLAVFSEMYYPYGWTAYIDGAPKDHFRVDYVLRALQIPAGKHTIEFRFEPEVIREGGKISLASSVLLLLMAIGGIYYEFRKTGKEDEGS